ncbi:MAG: BON domain-containing protein [Pirellulaceae bacterium]
MEIVTATTAAHASYFNASTRPSKAILTCRHQVFCQEESGIVVLHGRVGSFFQKQMAQESLKRLAGVEKVINELEVDWMASVQPR